MNLKLYTDRLKVLRSNFELKKRQLAHECFASYLDSIVIKHGSKAKIAKIVSNKFEVSPETLLKHYQRKLNQKEVWHKNRLLTKLEESHLLALIKTKEKQHKPMKRVDIVEVVKDLKNLDDNWQGSAWFSRFLKRNENIISCRYATPIESKRVSEDLLLEVSAFIECWEMYRRKFSEANGDCIVNVDETRVDSHVFGKKMLYLVSRDTKSPTIIENRSIMTMSLISFVTASGKTLLVVKVRPFLSKKQEKTFSKMDFQAIRKSRKRNRNVMFEATCYTKSGWVTKDVWKRSIIEFCRISKSFFNGRHSVLFMDRLSFHKDKESIELMKKHNIEGMFFPVKTSHFLQPLDQVIFAVFKNALRSEMRRLKTMRNLNKEKRREIFYSIIDNNIKKSFKSEIISSSWRKAGLWQWNRELIERRLFQNVGLEKSRFDVLMKKAKKSKSQSFTYSMHI